MSWWLWVVVAVVVIAAVGFLIDALEVDEIMSDAWRDRHEHGRDQR